LQNQSVDPRTQKRQVAEKSWEERGRIAEKNIKSFAEENQLKEFIFLVYLIYLDKQLNNN